MTFDVVLEAPKPPSLALERQEAGFFERDLCFRLEEMQRQKMSWLRSHPATRRAFGFKRSYKRRMEPGAYVN